MNTHPDLATRPTRDVEPPTAYGELSLAELLEVAHDDSAAPSAPTLSTLRAYGAQLRPWTHELTRRATLWGAGPQGAWRAW